MKNKILILLLFLCSSGVYAAGITTVSPPNNFNNPSFTVNFSWNGVLNLTSYRLKIATDSTFATGIIKDTIINNTSAQISFNRSTAYFYWKVTTANTSAYLTSPVSKLNFINPGQDNNVWFWVAADSNMVLEPDSTIDSWNNIVSGTNATQSIVSARPRLVNNVADLNNKRVVRFDGLNDYFLINGGGVVGSCYAVFNYTGGATFQDYNALLTHQSIHVFPDYYFEAANPGTSRFIDIGYFGTNLYLNNVLGVNSAGIPITPPALDKFRVVAGIKTASPGTAPNFTFGAEGSGYRFWKGDVAELIISKGNTTSESDSIHAYLFNKYSPPIAIKDTIRGNSFCTPVTVTAPPNFVSYLWSTGATTPTVSVTPNKSYSVKATDIFGFTSTTTFNLFPYARLNNMTVFLCKGDTFKLDLKTPAGFSAIWNTGATTTKLNISDGGQYTVKITDGGSCFVFDTINVVIDQPKLNPVPVSHAITLCEGEKIFVVAQTPFDSIHWSTGSTAPFISIVNQGKYTIYVRTAAGCILKDSFNVSIAGKAPTADFATGYVCENAFTSFTDISSIPIGDNATQWKWSFGDTHTGNTQNPTNFYTAAGSYTASLKVTTNRGCSDSIAKVIVVKKRPKSIFGTNLSCSGISTTFTDQSIPNAASITEWNWNFGGLGSSDAPQPSFKFPDAGSYNVQLTVINSNHCSDSATKAIVVNPSPHADFSFDSVCGKSYVSFKFLATVPPPSTLTTFAWDFGDGFTETAIKDKQHPYANPGTYTVQLAVRSSNQCVDTAVKQVKVFAYPVVDFTVSQSQCVGKEIQFTDISASPDSTLITKWNWYFSGLATSTLQNPRYTFNREDNYTIQLTATNEVGCSATKLRSIAVSSLPVPKFTFSPQNGLPPLNVTYTNQSPSAGNYIWDYGDGSPAVGAYNPPPHVYTVKGSYPIKLVATDFRGCTDTLVKYILVDKAYLDGVLATISITPDGDFYKVQVTIINSSNIEITALGLSLQLGGSSVIRENWTGSLLPGKSVVYLFIGEIKIGDNSQIPVVCATIDNVNNNSPEDRVDNNSTCKELKVGSFDILNIYPNPANESINFGIMLPQDGKINVRFVDVLGQILYNADYNGTKGYNNLAMSTMMLNASVYVAEVSYNGETIRKKFMRKDRK